MNTRLSAASQGPAAPPDATATENLRREFRGRIVTLSTGQPGLCGTLAVETAAAAPAELAAWRALLPAGCSALAAGLLPQARALAQSLRQ